MGALRPRLLTILLLLAAGLVFLSHRFFVPSPAGRRIRKAHTARPRAAAAADVAADAHGDTLHPHIPQVPAAELEDDADVDREAEAMEEENAAAAAAEAAAEEEERSRMAEEEDEEEDEEEAEEGEAVEGTDEGEPEPYERPVEEGAAGGPRPEAASLPLAASLAKGAVEAYPSPSGEFECTPTKTARPTRPLDYVVELSSSNWPRNCAGREDLCEVVRKTAVNREVLTAVCNSNIIGQLSKWVESNRRASIENMLIIAIDERLPTWLDENKVAYWSRKTSAAGSHKISAQKFMYVKEFLTIGCSVLMSDIDVVYLQNPFHFLHRDSDVEGTTDGWDDGSAYGWTESLDDPSLGAYGRFRPAMRITAWNSGLWYVRATGAGVNLMTILAHRMATEDTWDQAAFGEEMSRPARDDHLAAGITKRALNHWCFANSKTLFRRIRVEPRFANHVPVVVHANYHQPKEPRMRAVYDRWHLKQPDALNRFSGEQAFTVPPQELERDFLHMINDGFVSGANTAAASKAIGANGCKPLPSKHSISVKLHTLPRSACDAAHSKLCAAAAAVASTRASGAQAPELLLVVGSRSEDAAPLRIMLESARKAGVANTLLVLTDAGSSGNLQDSDVYAALGDAAPPTDGAGPRTVAFGIDDAEGARGAAVAKYEILGALLGGGYAVLHAAPTSVLLSDPFEYLYRDSDVEAMSSGWDDGSAYGYNHVLDDPSMGFTRFCHGSRIVAYEPGFFYAQPTSEALALSVRMAFQLGRKLTRSASYAEVAPAEREAFLHELWLPSHHEYASVGATLRVMNYLCFVNSKVLFRQLRQMPRAQTPVAVQINFHSDAPPRMAAVVSKYTGLLGDGGPLAALPLADTSASDGAEDAASCERSNDANPSLGTAGDAKQLVSSSPYAWGGIGDINFLEGGLLKTPWGDGKWGEHAAGSRSFFADFVGAKHNVRLLESGMGVSTRCADNNVVLVRSIKAAKAKS